jgi:hypothetical protein
MRKVWDHVGPDRWDVVDEIGSPRRPLGDALPRAPLFRLGGNRVNYLAVYQMVVRGHQAMAREDSKGAADSFEVARAMVGDHREGEREFGEAEALNPSLIIPRRSSITNTDELEAYDWPTVLEGTDGSLVLAPPTGLQDIAYITTWDVHLLLLKHIYLDLLMAELRMMERKDQEAISHYEKVTACPYLNLHLERAYVLMRQMEMRQVYADELYASEEVEGAFAEYARVLATYPKQSKEFFAPPGNTQLAPDLADAIPFGDDVAPELGDLKEAIVASNATLAPIDPMAVPPEGIPETTTNPAALIRLHRAAQAMSQISSGLNFLGYREDFVPVWRFEYLLHQARYFAQQARQGERDFLGWRERAEAEHERRRDLVQHRATQAAQVRMEDLRVLEARDSKRVVATNMQGLTERTQALEKLKELSNAQTAFDSIMNLFGSVASAAADVGLMVATGGSSALFSGILPSQIPGAYAKGAAGIGGALGTLGAFSFLGVPSAIDLQNAQFDLQRADLDAAYDVATKELEVAKTKELIAQQGARIAVLAARHLEENIAYLQDKPLSHEYWWELAKQIRENARRYLQTATHVAFLAEQAYEFEAGKTMNAIKFDYRGTPNGDVLAADFLMGDLDLIAADAVTSTRLKDVPIKLVVSLADKDPLGFAALRRNGRMSFQTSIPELDFAFPGAYNLRVRNVEVLVQALVGPEGVRGRLASSGFSLTRIKTPEGREGVSAVFLRRDGFLASAGPEYRIRGRFLGPDTMFLSHFKQRDDGALLSPPPEMLRVFEGMGAAAGWEIALPRDANTFDFSTLLDVKVAFYLTGHYDDGLRQIVEQKVADLSAQNAEFRTRRKMFSLRSDFPDAYYHFKNPANGGSTATAVFEVDTSQLPYNESGRRLRELAVYFLFDQSLETAVAIPFRLSFENVTANLSATTTTEESTIPTDPAAKLYFSELKAGSPLKALRNQAFTGPWRIEVDQDALVPSGQSLASILDVILGVTYQYDRPT